jgi:ElaB/YqjD/DUF883 family membrane-anchored ribosome-binding protein
MPPRNPELPEGTDHIINGAMATEGNDTDNIGGGSGGSAGGGLAKSGGASAGFIGAGADDDTGGNATGDEGGTAARLRDGANSLKQQASDRVRQFADDGKARASDALDQFSQTMNETAETIDERLGAQYGDYARRAASGISDFASTLRERDVDDLLDGARDIVRKSPVVAIGTAAAIGFALVRLIKAGLPDEDEGGQEQSGSGTGDTSAAR